MHDTAWQAPLWVPPALSCTLDVDISKLLQQQAEPPQTRACCTAASSCNVCNAGHRHMQVAGKLQSAGTVPGCNSTCAVCAFAGSWVIDAVYAQHQSKCALARRHQESTTQFRVILSPTKCKAYQQTWLSTKTSWLVCGAKKQHSRCLVKQERRKQNPYKSDKFTPASPCTPPHHTTLLLLRLSLPLAASFSPRSMNQAQKPILK